MNNLILIHYLFLIIIALFTLMVKNENHSSNCWSKRANLSQNDFALECTDDGHYKSVQCDNKTGYCFCVDVNTGKPDTQTTTRNRHLDCNNILNNQIINNNRFNSNNNNDDHQSIQSSSSLKSPNQLLSYSATAALQSIPKKQRRGRCSIVQRISYINQLIKKIEQQSIINQQQKQQRQQNNYARLPLGIQRPRSTTRSPTSNLIEFNSIIHKFNNFDQNNNHKLSDQEFMSMMNEISSSLIESTNNQFMINCAATMFEFCDHNHDLNVTRIEFIRCLDLQYTQILNQQYQKYRRQQNVKNVSNKMNNNKFNHQYDNNHSTTTTTTKTSINYNDNKSMIPLLMENTIINQKNETGKSGKNRNESSRRDCDLIRANSIESARFNPHGLVFIPKCSNGYYISIQCHLMHCWCVSRVTGQPIKALNKNNTENLAEACDQMRKGCDQRRRLKFHQQFRQSLSTIGYSCDSIYDKININDNDNTIDEMEFNQFIRQWFPKLFTNKINHRLKKCSRSEIRYCDQNDDLKLTRTEWIQCCRDNITIENNNLLLISSQNIKNTSSLTTINSKSNSYLGTNFFSTQFADAYNQKKNRPRFGQNPLKILNSE